MSAATWALVVVAGIAGALSRYGVGRLMGARLGLHAPWGVLAVNLLGAFLLGLLVGANPSRMLVIALGTGFLGSFTTFSTWMVETDAFAVAGRWTAVLLNTIAPLMWGLMLVAAGYAAGVAIS